MTDALNAATGLLLDLFAFVSDIASSLTDAAGAHPIPAFGMLCLAPAFFCSRIRVRA